MIDDKKSSRIDPCGVVVGALTVLVLLLAIAVFGSDNSADAAIIETRYIYLANLPGNSGLYRWHDGEKGATCWITRMYEQGSAISCIADKDLTLLARDLK